MKLKSTIAALLIVSSLSAVAADLTLSPLYTVVDVVRTALNTALSPLATTTEITANAGNSLKAVRNDAVTFLADGETTERLDASFAELKKIEGLENKSEIELANLIILSVE